MAQRTLFDNSPDNNRTNKALRPGWTRTGPHCGGTWTHNATGHTVHHCGHPTAIWPYFGTTNDGRMILAPNGHAFGSLAAAQLAMETIPKT